MRWKVEENEREWKIFRCSCGTCSELLTLCCLQVEEMRHKIPSTYGSEIKLHREAKKKVKKLFNVLSSSSTSYERQKKIKRRKMHFLFEMQLNYVFFPEEPIEILFLDVTIHWKEKKFHCCQHPHVNDTLQ